MEEQLQRLEELSGRLKCLAEWHSEFVQLLDEVQQELNQITMEVMANVGESV